MEDNTCNPDVNLEMPYILFDYYMDAADAGEFSREEGIKLYLADMATNNGAEPPLLTQE